MSTAYSGSTAISASPASASVRGTSRSAASADQVSRNAAATIASPIAEVSTRSAACHRPKRSEAAGHARSAMIMRPLPAAEELHCALPNKKDL